MKQTRRESQQISESLSDIEVDLAGVKLPVSSVTGGMLVVGQTGCGKTRSIINSLSRQFAELFTKSGKATAEHRRFAVFYFGLKGQGHSEFVASLPKRRRKDVVQISDDKDCPWVVRLFKRECWASVDELHLAVVNYVEEVAEELSGARSSGRHDPFWARQRTRLLSELCRLEVRRPAQVELLPGKLSDLTHDDALVALLSRIEAFFDFIAERSFAAQRPARKPLAAVRRELKKQGFGTTAELFRAEKVVAAYAKLGHAERHPKRRALCLFLAKILKQARQEKRTARPRMLLDDFADALEPSSREALVNLVEQFWRIPDTTRGCIEADLRGVVQSFHSGAARNVFGAAGKHEISIEEVIARGLIFVVDLPAADSGNASLPALIALKLAITQRLIGRYKSIYRSRPLCCRGVLVVQDEAQMLLGDSDAKALSLVREFGVVWLLATQSLSLVASVLGNHRDTEAFVGAARTRIFGATADPYTADMASLLCGRAAAAEKRAACLWHPTAALEAAVATSRRADMPLVSAHRFFALQTGQFYLRTADTGCYFLDMRFDLPRPRARALSLLGEPRFSDEASDLGSAERTLS